MKIKILIEATKDTEKKFNLFSDPSKYPAIVFSMKRTVVHLLVCFLVFVLLLLSFNYPYVFFLSIPAAFIPALILLLFFLRISENYSFISKWDKKEKILRNKYKDPSLSLDDMMAKEWEKEKRKRDKEFDKRISNYSQAELTSLIRKDSYMRKKKRSSNKKSSQ